MINTYGKIVRANPVIIYAAIFVIIGSVATMVMTEPVTFLKIAGALIFFVFLMRRPELALAIQFNGIAIYLYFVYKSTAETSSFMTASFYTAVAAAYLVGGYHIARSRRTIKLSSIDKLFLLLFSIFFISYLIFSLDNPLALRKVANAPILVIAPYLGLQLLSSYDQVRRFFTYCALLTMITIVPAVFELLTNPLHSEQGRFSIYTFADKGDNPIQFGISFALLLLIILTRMAALRRVTIFHGVLLLPAIYLLVRSGARGPFISFVVAFIFYVAWLAELRPRVKLGVLSIIAALLISAFSIIPNQTSDFYKTLLNPEMSPTNNPSANSIQERMIFMDLAIREFLDSPVIGVGTGNSVGGIGFPHNVIIEVAAEFGIVGLLILFSLLFVVVRTAVKNLHNDSRGQSDWLMNLAFTIFIFAFVEALFSAYMGGDILLYGSMGMISVVAKLYKHEASTPLTFNESNRWLERYI